MIIKRTTVIRKQKWKKKKKQLYQYSKRQTGEKTWTWLRKGNFKRESESLLIAAQNDAITTNYVKAKIDKLQENSKYWFNGDWDETIDHIINECKFEKREFDHTTKWYKHKLESVLENGMHKFQTHNNKEYFFEQ